MLRIFDKEGKVLERASMVFEPTQNLRYLSIELKIKNEFDRAVNNPGLFLLPSSLDGDIFSFSNQTPGSILSKVLLREAIKIEQGNFIPPNTFFNFNNGSREDNKIVIIDRLQPNEYINIKLTFDKQTFETAEFLYIGLSVK